MNNIRPSKWLEEEKMPFQVQQLIEGRGMPVCVAKEDMVSKALAIMIEYDYSQLPVITKKNDLDIPEGMITYEGILRGIRNFNAGIQDLRVRDVMVPAPTYSVEDDLFDILDRLKDTNAVLILDIYGPDLVGIVTSYDTTEYFRDRTEDLMRVEDIELMIKEFIKDAYLDKNGEVIFSKLDTAANQISHSNWNGENQKEKTFEDLNLSEYIALLLCKENWPYFSPIFGVQRSYILELLNGVREIRNSLAHFRGDLSAEQRDRLKFATEWLTRCQEEYQKPKEQESVQELFEIDKQIITESANTIANSDSVNIFIDPNPIDFSVSESISDGGRYAPLADWLQSQPGNIDTVQLTFNQIEQIINNTLPISAQNHRAWWANDSVGHSHSQLWLAAGWRTTSINLTENKITFNRIREREKAYITFFSKLLDELRKKAEFSIRETSPDGASWIVILTIPHNYASYGSFTFSFSRDKKLRVELYLDLGDQIQTKNVFDIIYSQKNQFESQLGEIVWERLDNRRASRIAQYRDGSIIEEKDHAELRKWAVDSMIKFISVLMEPAEKAIIEIKFKTE